MTKVDKFVEKLINLTDDNHISWDVTKDTAGQSKFFSAEFLGIQLTLSLWKLSLLVKKEEVDNDRFLYSPLLEDLRLTIAFQLFEPWFVQESVDTILEWEGEENGSERAYSDSQ